MDELVNIIRKNIAELSDRKLLCSNSRNYWIAELVKGLSKTENFRFAQIADTLVRVGADSVEDFIVAAKTLRDLSLFELHTDISLDHNEEKPKIISYFKNDLSQKAFTEFFSGDVCETVERDSYGDSFEDVYNENAFFCIAPIENTSSGKLINFYSLIANYNLKICKICDVEHQGQEASTTFALLTAAPIEICERTDKNNSLEVSVSASMKDSLSRIIEAAAKCGMYSKRINSIPFEHLKNEYYYNIVFSLDKKSELLDFLCFLYLDGTTYTPIGIY